MGKRKEIDLMKMKVLYNQGLNDREIAEKLGCNRELIKDRRHEMNLPSNTWRNSIWNRVDEVKELFEDGKSSTEISKLINVSITTLSKFKKQFNIKGAYDMKMSSKDIDEAMNLAKKGMMDTEIAKIFGVSSSDIAFHRKNRGIASEFTYDKISKINNKKFEELFKRGLNDNEIAHQLGMSSDGIYSHRIKYGYLRESFKEAKNNPLTQDNIEIILGVMMGDGTMECPNKNARMTFAHCPQQKEYRDYIAKKLSNLKPHLYFHKAVPDKRTGKCYDSYWCNLPANPAFNDIYNHFYVDGKKRIPIELFSNFTWQSLAYMYMDDGCIQGSGGKLATNGFTVKDIHEFQQFLLNKFSLKTTMCKDNTLYIKAKSFRYMKSQIEPFMCDCMKYKIR